jgi:ATP synthase protein I
VARVEPEREVVRRSLPFIPASAVLAFAIGALTGGRGVAWSAVIGVGVVAANFVANALSIAWAARISPMLVAAVALGGFFLRMVAIVVVLVLLNTLAWFSPVAFALAVVPATATLLVFEAKVLFGRMQGDLWSIPGAAR